MQIAGKIQYPEFEIMFIFKKNVLHALHLNIVGYAGGSLYSDPGGAAEYVCLPPDPIYVNPVYFTSAPWGHIYVAE